MFNETIHPQNVIILPLKLELVANQKT